MEFNLFTHYVDIFNKRVFPADITIISGIITKIEEKPASDKVSGFALPGFIDSHVHIESSMLVPSEFARMALVHGTVATVSDPHEIANVLGIEGVEFMIEDGKRVPFYFNFGAPSCVPATTFETAGAELNIDDVKFLLEKPEIKYLAEMMNWPGVLFKDPIVFEKIKASQKLGKPVDGHAPGLMGKEAETYFSAGISTDHECFSFQEALNKAQLGVKILIREGSAAKNFDDLIPIITEFPKQVMFCCDDKHPDSLEIDHIDGHVRRAIEKGYDLFDVLYSACILPHQHYNLNHGLLRVGDSADFIIVKDLKSFKVQKTYIKGKLTAENGKTLLPKLEVKPINKFESYTLKAEDFKLESSGEKWCRVIECLDGQLITNELHIDLETRGEIKSNTEKDILKLVVVNRYQPTKPSIALIKNFGLKSGAIASSVAHDSHNIVAVGVDDICLAQIVNNLMKSKGGLAVCDGSSIDVLPLPIAGLMTDKDGWETAKDYTRLDSKAKSLGSTLKSPFMSLSFMALLVIPSLKLSDKGLFNGKEFTFTPLFFDKPE